MGSSKSGRALEAMRNRSLKIIGTKHPSAQEALLQGLLQGVNVRDCTVALADLLAANVAPPRLMMTLLQCQPILFNLLADLKSPDRWHDLSSRFYRVQETLIAQSEAMLSHLDDEINAVVNGEADPSPETNPDNSIERPPVANNPDNATYIDWLHGQNKLRLFNLFRGVVINANCQLLHLDSGHDQVSIELNNELGRVLAADPNATSATLVADEKTTIGFPLHLVDHTPGTAIFTLLAPQPIHIDQRDGIDVHVQDLVHINIHKGLYKFPEGTLVDFSATGIGLVAPKDDRIKINLDDVLDFRFQIGMAKVVSEGKVRGLRDQGDHYLLGVKLATNRATQSLLQREVFRVQREIIVTLNEEGVPEDLIENIR